MKLRIITSTLLVTALLAATALSGCTESAPPPVKIAFSEEAHSQILHLIKQQEFDQDQGIEAQLYPTTSPAETGRLFRNGVVDFAISDLNNVVAMSEYEQVTIVAVIGKMQGTRALLARPNIESIADIRGRKVGAYRGNNRFLDSIFEAEGITDSDVEFVYVPNIENESLLIPGDIDIIVALEPQVTRLKRAGFRELYGADKTSIQPIYVLVGDSDYVHKNPQTVDSFLESWGQGIAFSDANPKLTAGILGPKIGLSAKEFEELFARFTANRDLHQGFEDDFSLDFVRFDPVLFEAQNQANKDNARILLYWQE